MRARGSPILFGSLVLLPGRFELLFGPFRSPFFRYGAVATYAAYDLANLLRQLALPRSVRKWNLPTLREKLVKIRAMVVTHSKYVIFRLAEPAVPRQLFAAIVERIQWLACTSE